MNDKLPEIINYIIGAGLLAVLLFVLKKKSVEQPLMKVSGLSIQTIITLIYVAIAIYLILIVAILMGWITN